jgi:iron(III) transport system substrate-binding protein
MRRHFIVATAMLLAGSPVTHAQDNRLSVICSGSDDYCNMLQATFSKSTGIGVSMVRKSTGEALAQILAERANPKTDIWFGGTGDPHMQAAEQELTLEYKSPTLPQLHPWAQKQAEQAKYRTVGVYFSPLCFAYNTELITKKKLPIPKTWADLLKPEYKGEVQMANPNSSGTAYTVIATLVQLMGEDKAFDYVGKLHRNISTYQRSGVGPLKAVARGEATVSISQVHDAAAERLNGMPVQMVTPADGTGAETGSMSIVKGAPHLENAKRFYEWALTPQAQQLAAAAKSFQVPSNKNTPLDARVIDLKEVKLVDYDNAKYGSTAERRRLIQRWERVVNQQAN